MTATLNTSAAKPAATKKVAADSIEAFLATLPVSGSPKKAEAITEPGSMDGESTHPTAKAEDHVQDAPEGEQTKENIKQVKEQVGPASVDSADAKEASVSMGASKRLMSLSGMTGAGKGKEKKMASPTKKADEVAPAGTSGTAESDQLQIGPKKTPTGEDPEHETGMATPGYPDPGTSHPAATDNESLNGGKYANFTEEDFAKLSLPESQTALNKLANAFFSALDRDLSTNPTPTNSAAVHSKAGAAVADAVIDNSLNQEAYELARSKVASWYAEGVHLGNLVADHLEDRAYRKKLADDMAGGGPPPGPPGGGGPPPDDGGGAGGPGGPGGPPPGPGGHHDGGGAGMDMDPEQIMQLLQQLGITPEELQQLAAEQGGAGGPPGGGAAPTDAMAGGPPPSGPPPAGGMTAMASDRMARRKRANLANTARIMAEALRRSRR